MPDTLVAPTGYSIAGDENSAIRLAIINTIQVAAREREQLSALTIEAPAGVAEAQGAGGVGAPSNIWDMGTWMYEDGTNHLPPVWRNETCPKDLHLGTVPTFNFYKRIVEILRGSVLKVLPSLEFSVEETAGDSESDVEMDGVLGRTEDTLRLSGVNIPPPAVDEEEAPDEHDETVSMLNELWKETAQDSRLLAELDLCLKHDCNYGMGFIGLHRSRGKDYIRAVHPQLVLYDASVERVQDLTWIAKISVKPRPANVQRTYGMVAIDANWPQSIMNRPISTMVFMEIWILKGTVFAGRNWEEHGAHIVLGSDNSLVSEKAWDLDYLPLLPVSLLPGERLRGEALSQTLWSAQVRVDKTLAVLLARTSRAAGEKYQIGTDNAGPKTKGVGLTETAVSNLKHPGTQVVMSQVPITPFPPPKIPKELAALFQTAIRDMEVLAGISQAFQGIAPKSVTAGVAIQALAEQSAGRVNRMASHLAESLRLFGKMWAAYELAKRGMELPPTFKVKVTLAVMEEEDTRKQFEKIKDIAGVWESLPAELLEILVETIPGLTRENKENLLELLQRRKEQERQALEQPEGQEGLPGQPGAPLPAQAPEGGGAPPAPAPAPPLLGPMLPLPPGVPPSPVGVPQLTR